MRWLLLLMMSSCTPNAVEEPGPASIDGAGDGPIEVNGRDGRKPDNSAPATSSGPVVTFAAADGLVLTCTAASISYQLRIDELAAGRGEVVATDAGARTTYREQDLEIVDDGEALAFFLFDDRSFVGEISFPGYSTGNAKLTVAAGGAVPLRCGISQAP